MTKDLVREINQLHAQVCSGLADSNRILILYTLDESYSNVSDLAKTLDISQPSASHHLKVLKDCGMVSSERKGQSVIYQVADKRIIMALDILRTVLKDSLKNQMMLVQPPTEENIEQEITIN
jgi:ArsR family transcriptional regulator